MRRWRIVATGGTYSMGICFRVFFKRSCAALAVVYCSTTRCSEGEQENAPHGVGEVHAPHAWGATHPTRGVRVRRTHPSRIP